MKPTTFPNTFRVLSGSLVGTLLCLSNVLAEAPPNLDVYPQSLTITAHSAQENLQGRRSVFDSQPASGTSIVAMGRFKDPLEAKLVPSECKLDRLVDSEGSNLLAEPAKDERGPFGPSSVFNRREPGLQVRPAGNGDAVHLELHSDSTPSAKAAHVEATGTLRFAPEDAAEELEHPALAMINEEVVEIGPARLRFTKGDAPFQNNGAKPIWYVQVLPSKEMTNTRIVLYGEDEDLPIFDTANNRSVITRTLGRPGKDPFSGVTARGFQCPSGELSRIKLRYTDRSKLIEVPFTLKVGLGSFATE